MFENKHEPMLSLGAFVARLSRSVAVTIGVIVVSLGIGGLGYHVFGRLEWLDAFLNAAMILTGMGPVDPMKSSAGKVFAMLYALYSGIAFLTIVAVLMAPLLHRMLHSFHVNMDDDAPEKSSGDAHDGK